MNRAYTLYCRIAAVIFIVNTLYPVIVKLSQQRLAHDWFHSLLHLLSALFGAYAGWRANRNGDPDIPQCFRGQIARVPAPSARDIFSSHTDEIGINVVVRELGDVRVSRKFRPMFQDPSVGVNRSI